MKFVELIGAQKLRPAPADGTQMYLAYQRQYCRIIDGVYRTTGDDNMGLRRDAKVRLLFRELKKLESIIEREELNLLSHSVFVLSWYLQHPIFDRKPK